MELLLAGFGGQGILFAGKILAHAGLLEGKQVSWLPSYGPEMRGGTANCSVCISDLPIGSPLVLHPKCLIAMNLPSFEKFVGAVAPGGTAIIDSSLIDCECPRGDITCHRIRATALAEAQGLAGLANIVMLGKALKSGGPVTLEAAEQAIRQCISPRKKHLLEPNIRAFRLGLGL